MSPYASLDPVRVLLTPSRSMRRRKESKLPSSIRNACVSPGSIGARTCVPSSSAQGRWVAVSEYRPPGTAPTPQISSSSLQRTPMSTLLSGMCTSRGISAGAAPSKPTVSTRQSVVGRGVDGESQKYLVAPEGVAKLYVLGSKSAPEMLPGGRVPVDEVATKPIRGKLS